MSDIKLSDYIARRLKEYYNIKHVFMVSGGGAMHLNDSLGRYIPYTANHHEQASALCAEGFARVKQELVVVNVTTGPGGLNCLNGVFGAWTDSVPVLYISGQVKRTTMMESYPELSEYPLRQLGDQEVDIVSIVKPITKYAITVKNPNDIKYCLDKAIYEATNGRKGPVWINIPIDVQASIINEDNLKDFIPEPQIKYNLKINDVIKKLKSAQRPVIIAGHGIRLSNMIQDFYCLVDKLKIPVLTTFNSFDIMPDSNEYYIGRIGTVGQRAGNFVLQNSDLLLCLGTRNNIRQVSYNWKNFGEQAYKIVVDIDEGELNKPLVIPDLKIQADLKEFIPELLKKTSSFIKNEEWLSFCKNLKTKYSFKNHPEQIQKKDKVNPYHFTYELTKALNEGDLFIMANGSSCVCPFQNAVVKKNQRYILNSGNASMGFALPAAIGAYYSSNKNSNIVCLEGDGSIMMNLQELQTIAYNKLPIKIFVINNNGYSSIRQTQRNFFEGRMTASGINSGVSVPNFYRVAKAFDIKAFKITKPDQILDIIKSVLDYDGPALCEVMTEQEYAFLPKLSSKKLDNGTMISPSLEDMFPFLNREEFSQNMKYVNK